MRAVVADNRMRIWCASGCGGLGREASAGWRRRAGASRGLAGRLLGCQRARRGPPGGPPLEDCWHQPPASLRRPSAHPSRPPCTHAGTRTRRAWRWACCSPAAWGTWTWTGPWVRAPRPCRVIAAWREGLGGSVEPACWGGWGCGPRAPAAATGPQPAGGAGHPAAASRQVRRSLPARTSHPARRASRPADQEGAGGRPDHHGGHSDGAADARAARPGGSADWRVHKARGGGGGCGGLGLGLHVPPVPTRHAVCLPARPPRQVRALQPQAVAAWWQQGHPGWAIYPVDSEQFLETGTLDSAAPLPMPPAEPPAPPPAGFVQPQSPSAGGGAAPLSAPTPPLPAALPPLPPAAAAALNPALASFMGAAGGGLSSDALLRAMSPLIHGGAAGGPRRSMWLARREGFARGLPSAASPAPGSSAVPPPASHQHTALSL